MNDKIMYSIVYTIFAAMFFFIGWGLYSIATETRECMNNAVYTKVNDKYWKKTSTECIPITKD